MIWSEYASIWYSGILLLCIILFKTVFSCLEVYCTVWVFSWYSMIVDYLSQDGIFVSWLYILSWSRRYFHILIRTVFSYVIHIESTEDLQPGLNRTWSLFVLWPNHLIVYWIDFLSFILSRWDESVVFESGILFDWFLVCIGFRYCALGIRSWFDGISLWFYDMGNQSSFGNLLLSSTDTNIGISRTKFFEEGENCNIPDLRRPNFDK